MNRIFIIFVSTNYTNTGIGVGDLIRLIPINYFIMGIKVLTVKTLNSDASYAGSVLLNSKYIANDMRLIDTNDSFFSYGMGSDAKVFEKYTVDETLTTTDDIYTAVNKTFYTLPVYDDVNDSSSSTTNMPIDAEDIVKGIALGSDTDKSLLWIESNGKVDKFLVNKSIQAIEDYIMTGTTTTTSTTTSTTSTTSTTTTTTTHT